MTSFINVLDNIHPLVWWVTFKALLTVKQPTRQRVAVSGQTSVYFWWHGITTIVCIRSLFITYSYFNISAGYDHMLITYMYMPTDMYYYILDLSPLFLGCLIGYLRPGLGSSTLHQVQVQVQVFSFFILQVQVQVQVQWFCIIKYKYKYKYTKSSTSTSTNTLRDKSKYTNEYIILCHTTIFWFCDYII